MPRKDVLHHPVLTDAGVPTCKDCQTVLACNEAVTAIAMDCALVDVAGLGAAFYPAEEEFAGSEVLRCTHPAVKGQSNEIVVQECSDCGASGHVDGAECIECLGSGLVGLLPDGDGGWQKLRVSAQAMADQEGEVKPATPLTEVEKMQRRGAFQNWLAMREVTRPEGLTEAS